MILGSATAIADPPDVSFATPIQVTEPDGYAYSLTAVADVTGDGRADLVMTVCKGADYWYHWCGYQSATDYHLYVWAQQVDGSLSATPSIALQGSGLGSGIPVAGDINGDGSTDIAVVTDQGMDIYYQSGGALAPPTFVPTTGYPSTPVIADLNNDGRADLVFTRSSSVYFMSQQPDGSFGESTLIGPGTCMAIGDYNDDGLSDVATCQSGSVVTYLQQAGGGFTSNSYPISASPLVAGDVNGDGKEDLVGGVSGGVRVMTQGPSGLVAQPLVAGPDIGNWSTLVDINGDGRLDLVDEDLPRARPWYWLQDASGSFVLGCLGPANVYQQLVTGDLNGDGVPDFVGNWFGTDSISYGSFTSPPVSGSSISSSAGNTGTTKTGPNWDPMIMGTVEFQSQGCWRDPSVEVFRNNPDSTTSDLGPAPIDPMDGSFSYTDSSITDPGSYNYYASWAGDASHTGSQGATWPIFMGTSYTYLGSVLPLKWVKYGATTQVTAYLQYGPPDATLSLTANGAVVDTQPVDSHGSATFDVQPKDPSEKYQVTYAGNQWYVRSATDEFSFRIQPVLTGAMVKYNRKKGKFAIYKPAQTVYFETDMKPPLSGKLEMTLDASVNAGHWFKVGHQTFTLNDYPTFTIYFKKGSLPTNVPFRISTSWTKGNIHSGTGWSYFEVVGPGGGARISSTPLALATPEAGNS